MRRPGIVSLHAVTSTNALQYAFQTVSNDETRRLLLLQNAAFLTRFRGEPEKLKHLHLDELQASDGKAGKTPEVDQIFAQVSHDRSKAARA